MNLEQQKKQARDLLRAIRAGNTEAISRLRRHHTRWTGLDDGNIRQLVALHDAQFVLAREQGFASWPKLKAYATGHSRLFVADADWLTERVHSLMRTRDGLSEDDARLVYARDHGFETWDDLLSRVQFLAANPAAVAASEPFMAAFDALKAGVVVDYEGLARERGTNGNTLLNLAVSLGNLTAIRALLAAGADVNEGNDHGATPLHQAGYANRPDIAELLIENGADLDVEAHGAGGTPLIFALFWGHREVADLLGRHSTAPGNLRAAAGLGNPELVEACFHPDGSLTHEACAARGFYRPHSGFPDWQPSTDPQEVLDEALVWACKSGRVAVLERLVRAGARVNADPYRGTPLIWAAVKNRVETIAWLLDHGADVNQKATFGGLTHGQGITALHMAAQNGHLAAVKLLLDRGADRTIRDDLYQSTAESAADYFGQDEVHDYLSQGPDGVDAGGSPGGEEAGEETD